MHGGGIDGTFEDLNPHAFGVLFISFKGNVADK